MLRKHFKKQIYKAVKNTAIFCIEMNEKSLKKIDNEQRSIMIYNFENVKSKTTKKAIKRLQDTCNHKHDNGESAISDDAFASPYSQKYCSICQKYF